MNNTTFTTIRAEYYDKVGSVVQEQGYTEFMHKELICISPDKTNGIIAHLFYIKHRGIILFDVAIHSKNDCIVSIQFGWKRNGLKLDTQLSNGI